MKINIKTLTDDFEGAERLLESAFTQLDAVYSLGRENLLLEETALMENHLDKIQTFHYLISTIVGAYKLNAIKNQRPKAETA